MNNNDIIKTAKNQSAVDLSCSPDDFDRDENVIVYSHENSRARRYLALPFACNLVTYGKNIVASVDRTLEETVGNYINSYPKEHCFETPNMHILNSALSKNGYSVCFMAEYFLPDMTVFKVRSCDYETRILEKTNFSELYLPQWNNALCEKRKALDMLCVGAYDGEKLVGLAGASADCDTMWQIGIDVLPEYRNKGIASSLTTILADEIIKKDKVPFYCAAWSNLASVRNALKSGFRPAWCEMTAKSTEFVDEMNKTK